MIQTIRSVSAWLILLLIWIKQKKDIVDNYEKKTAWCGGFKAACEKYYQRIAIVRADTLEVIRPIYPNK